MKKTTVVNVNTDAFDVFIGRPSVYGNPFIIGRDGDRNAVIDKFKEYWYAPEQKSLRERALEELPEKTIGCFCKPSKCHGDIIASYVNDETKKNNTIDLTTFLE